MGESTYLRCRAPRSEARRHNLECSFARGFGMKKNDEAMWLIEAVRRASIRHDMPMYVETHRATIFQDTWRERQLRAAVSGVALQRRLSNWYTGLEFVYGDFDRKLAFIRRSSRDRVHSRPISIRA